LELSVCRSRPPSIRRDSHFFYKAMRVAGRSVPLLVLVLAQSAGATDLKPATSAAFDHYVAVTESVTDAEPGQFLVVDRLPDAQSQAAYSQLRRGEPYIEELRTKEDGHSIPIPSGLVHHWAGVIFIPKGTLAEVMAILQDYEEQPRIYKPDVRQSRLIGQHGDELDLFEQFYSKSIVSVVLNVNFHIVQTHMGSGRCQTISRSTRLVEVSDPGGPDEHELPEGRDHGYMWRLNSYWRIEEKDGGVYVQNESISLSRTIPTFFAWIIEPLTKSVPRDLLGRMLTNTRDAVMAAEEKEKQESSGGASATQKSGRALEAPAR
jgi:hypothetical protein